MGAIADRSQSVDSRRVQAGRIAVRAAAGTRLVQIETKFISCLLHAVPQFLVARCRLHGWTTNIAVYMQAHIARGRLERMDDVLDLIARCDCWHSYIDDCRTVRRNHIGLNAT